MFLWIVGEDERDALLFVDPEHQRAIAQRRARSGQQRVRSHIPVIVLNLFWWIEGGDALGSMKASSGGLDLKHFVLFEANRQITAAVSILRVHPEKSRAALIFPLLVFIFLREQFQRARPRVAELERTDAYTGFNHGLDDQGSAGLGILRSGFGKRLYSGNRRLTGMDACGYT